jgi:PAS domain S-box-containing protein
MAEPVWVFDGTGFVPRQQLGALIEASTDLIGLAELDGRITYFNEAGLRLLGLDSLDEARGRTLFDFVMPEDLPALRAQLLPALEQDGQWEGEWRYRNVKTGEPVLVSKKVTLIRDPATGAPTAYATVSRDIADRKRAEDALRESEERFRSMADSTPALVWLSDLEMKRTYFNRTWLEFVGRPVEAELGDGWVENIHPDYRDRYLTTYRTAFETRKPFEIEYLLRRHDGEYRWVLARGTPRFTPSGGFAGFVGLCLDITDRRRAEDRLREEVRVTEALNRLGGTLATERDLGAVVQAVTDEATRLTEAQFGAFFYNVVGERGEAYTLYAISGVPWAAFDRFPMPRNTAVFEPTFRGQEVVRLADVTKDPRYGRSAPYHGMPEGHLPVRSYLAVPVVSRSGEVLGGLFFGHERTGMFTDRHERLAVGVAAQAAIAIDNARLYEGLRKSLRRFQSLTEAIPQMVWTTDPAGRVTYFNRRWQEYTGLTAEPDRETGWAGVAHPEDADRLTTGWRLAVHSGADHFSQEFRLRRAADGAYRWMLSSAVPLRDEAGATVEWVGTLTDIDDQKRQADRLERMVRDRTAALEEANAALRQEVEERKRTQAELQRSNDELDKFAYVASHDLQEPLRKIQAFGDRLRVKYRDHLPDGARDYVDRMLASAGRMRRLIDDLLAFSRVTTQARPFEPVDLGDVLRDVLSDLDVRIEKTRGRIDVGPLPTIDADPSQIRQLFQNLLVNALKFHRPGVPPVVAVRGEVVAEPGPDGPNPLTCRVSVRDNGIGFDEKYLGRIFQVFQRLHGRNEYEGTGVGLAICRKIAERHGGSITATSRPGDGATFVVTLPVRQPREGTTTDGRPDQADYHPDGR